MPSRSILYSLALLSCTAGVQAEDAKSRILLVTHAGGFIHESAAVSEAVIRELGAKNGVQVTCYRFTSDPDAKIKVKRKVADKEVEIETTALEEYSARFRARTGETVEKSQCGRVNAES